MPSSRVTPYKADGADVWVVADEVDAVVLAVDNINSPVRSPGVSEQLYQGHAGGGIPLAGLHDVGVAGDQS